MSIFQKIELKCLRGGVTLSDPHRGQFGLVYIVK